MQDRLQHRLHPYDPEIPAYIFGTEIGLKAGRLHRDFSGIASVILTATLRITFAKVRSSVLTPASLV